MAMAFQSASPRPEVGMPLEFVNNAIYTVKSGDTLSGIAAAHDVSLRQLIAANAGLIDDPGLIQVGWQLCIPGRLAAAPPRGEAPPSGAPVEERVIETDDTLSGLAAQWGCTVAAIAELNGIANPSLVFVGQRIRRPGSTPV